MEFEHDVRHGESRAVCVGDDKRQQRVAGEHADACAQGGCGESVYGEFEHHIRVAVAERLQRSGIGAFLVHHASHGAEGDERRDEVEEDREDVRQFRHDAFDDHVHTVALRGQAFAAAADGIGRDGEIVDLLLGEGYLPFGFGYLAFGFGLLRVEFGEFALVFRFGLVDVPLALDKLRDAVCDLLASLRHRFAELVLFFGYLFGCLCEIVRIAPIRLRALVEPRYGVLVLLQSRIVGVQLSVVFGAGFVVLVDRHVVFAAYLFVEFAGDAGLFPFAERRADFVEHGFACFELFSRRVQLRFAVRQLVP